MSVSFEQLLKIMPLSRPHAAPWVTLLNQAMDEYSINTPRRITAFLAQVAQESCELRYVRELASGADYDTGRLAARLGNTPEADGDGQKYKGRGLIQVTGTDNYRKCSMALFSDPQVLLDHPERLEERALAARSAAWFWWSNGLNTLADTPNSFQAITKRVNGGLNHYAERLQYFDRAKKVIV